MQIRCESFVFGFVAGHAPGHGRERKRPGTRIRAILVGAASSVHAILGRSAAALEPAQLAQQSRIVRDRAAPD